MVLTLNRPVSIQPSYLQTKLGSIRIPNKVLENGQLPGEVDEETLRKGEAKYTSYFQEPRIPQINPQALAPFT